MEALETLPSWQLSWVSSSSAPTVTDAEVAGSNVAGPSSLDATLPGTAGVSRLSLKLGTHGTKGALAWRASQLRVALQPPLSPLELAGPWAPGGQEALAAHGEASSRHMGHM